MGRKDAATKRFCSESYTQPVGYTGQEEKRQYLERVRDVKMLHKYGSTIRILAIEHQSYIDYGMPVRCLEQDFTMFHTSLRSVFEILPLRKDKKRLLEKLTGD